MKRAAVLLAILASLVSGTAARAEEPVALTVTGSSAPGFSSKSTEGERPRDTPDAAALLEGLPGLRVRRLGGEASFATLSIRGAASNQVAISFAGVPLTGASDPSLDLATLPLWPGANARVYRTFAPAHLGGGYLGGIVDIAPMDPTRDRTEVYNAYGSFGSYRMRVADTHAIGAFRVGTSVSYHRTDGDYVYRSVRPYPPYDGEDVRRRNNASQQLAGVIQARHEGERWTWLVTSLLTTRRDGIAGPISWPALATHMARDRALFAVETRKRDDDGRFIARLWARRDGRTFEDPLAETGFLPSSTRDRVLASGFALGRSLTVSKVTLDPRVDGSVETRTAVRSEPTPAHSRARIALAIDATYRWSPATSVVLAARGDVRRDSAQSPELLPAAHLGAEHTFNDWVTLGAHVGTLARAPSFLELLGDGGVYSASPGLRSERSYAADLGLRARSSRGRVRLEGELVGFVWEVRDLIVVLPNGVRTLRADNIGAARLAGAEVSAAASSGPIRAVASYTALFSENRTSEAATRGARLPGRPAHDVTLDVSARISNVTLRYGFDLVSPTTLDRAGLNVLPTRMFHGVGARLELASVSVIGEVANVFDQRTVSVLYETGRPLADYPISDFLGYPLPGRRFTLAVRGTL